MAGNQLEDRFNGQQMLIDGRGPEPGERFQKSPDLGRTLRTIAEGDKKRFYGGANRGRDRDNARYGPGDAWCMSDLAGHASTWDVPISTTHSGPRIRECPPNGQGIACLLAVNILEGFDLPEDRFVLMTAYTLKLRPCDWLLPIRAGTWRIRARSRCQSRSYYRRNMPQSAENSSTHARPPSTRDRGTPTAGSDTVYFCVVDKWGNACSFINSNYNGFGTGIVPDGCGFTLQNRGHCFSLDPNHPNALAPGKRPYHTIIPAMITRERSMVPFLDAMGVMGGYMQPQGHLQVFLALTQGYDPQTALDLPGLCIDDGSLRWSGIAGGWHPCNCGPGG